MPKVIYNGPHGAVNTPDGREFKKGDPVEVSQPLADRLVAQGFTLVKSEKGKP